MFYNDPKIKINFLKVTNPGKLIPFSGHPYDFIGINLKPLVPIQPFGESKPCILQGLFPGQAIENAGNNQNTIQNDVLLIPPKKTIRFDGHLESYQKPFKKYHINRACRFDVLIIPFSFDYSSIPSNRIYPIRYLLFFVDWLRCQFDPYSLMVHDNQPLTIDDIEGISKNDKKRINLIYTPTFDKQFHSLSITNHSLSIIFNHFLMFRNDKFYLHIFSICTYIKSSICIYNISAFMDLKKHVVQGVQRGIPFGCICIYNKLSTYISTYTK